jgi:hypothetical protein
MRDKSGRKTFQRPEDLEASDISKNKVYLLTQ